MVARSLGRSSAAIVVGVIAVTILVYQLSVKQELEHRLRASLGLHCVLPCV